MEEDKKKTKEYYQVNLDTGRIFWIVFVVGIVVIGIFFLGLLFGGGKEKKNIFSFDRTKLFQREYVEEKEQEVTLLDLIESDLEEESRYIEIEEIQAPAEKVEEIEEVRVEKIETKPVEVPVSRKEPKVEVFKPSKPRTVYIARGDYYIQVASFLKEENASAMAEQLRKKLYKVEIEKAQVNERTFYRVRVGPFETEGVAKNTMISMKKRYNLKDPFVVKRRS
jgi:cell division septation protein DedD